MTLVEKIESRKREHILKRSQLLGSIHDIEVRLNQLKENICAYDGAIEECDRIITDIKLDELTKAETVEALKKAKREAKCQQSKTL